MLWGQSATLPLHGSPEVPFVGGILDVVADVVEHPMSRRAITGIEHLEGVHQGIECLLLPPMAPPGQPSPWRRVQSHSSCCPTGLVSSSLTSESQAGFNIFFLLSQ